MYTVSGDGYVEVEGERYDMNYVYYIDDKNWHGAALYYEYPCVFLYVLVAQYLGVDFGFDCDVIIKRWQDYTGKQATLESTGENYNSMVKDNG